MKTLVTPRLILRPLRKGDAAALCDLFADAATMRHLLTGRPMSRDEALAFMDRRFTGEDEPDGLNVLFLRETGALVGFAGLLPTACLGAEDYEFGFAVAGPFRGRGYATEIGCGQIQYAFEALGLRRVLALVHPENPASRAVVERHLEMERIGAVPASEERDIRHVFSRERRYGLPAARYATLKVQPSLDESP